MAADIDDLKIELDEAFYSYLTKIQEIFDKYDDTVLETLAGDVVPDDRFQIDYDRFISGQARIELSMRHMLVRAKRVMDRPGFSGVYCVHHDCDMKDCAGKHGDDS